MSPFAISRSVSAAILLAASILAIPVVPASPVATSVHAEGHAAGLRGGTGVSSSKSTGNVKRYIRSRSVLDGPSVRSYRVRRDLPATYQRKSNSVYLDTAASRRALGNHDRQVIYRNSLRDGNVQRRTISVTGGRDRRGGYDRRDFDRRDFRLRDGRSGVYLAGRPDRNGYIRNYRRNGPLIISRSGNTNIDNSVNVTNEFNGNFVGGIAVVNGGTGSMREIAGSSVKGPGDSTVCKYGTYCTIDLGGPKIITFNDVGDINEEDLQ